MAEHVHLYPPAPSGIPVDLARPSLQYRLHVILVLLMLFLFLFIYVALLGAPLYVMYCVIWPMGEDSPQPSGILDGFLLLLVRIGVFAVSLMLFVFLLKAFFKRGEDEGCQHLEITAQQQPKLFEFIRSLCQEIHSPLPAHVYINPNVNAAVLYSTSILNLVVPPRKDLLIGLGLIQGLNIVEFKAILAHEFGHFSQRSLRLSSYTLVVYRVIYNMVYVRDRWDNLVIRAYNVPIVSGFAAPLYVLAQLMRMLLHGIFTVFSLAHSSLSRQMEFNADLVAVTVSGSDAPVNALLRSEFSNACLQQAAQDLVLAAEHGLFTWDLFFHQRKAAEFLRAANNEPDFGKPPAVAFDASLPVQVFTPNSASTATMWDDHPSHYDREVNVKHNYWPSPQDVREAWLLFHDSETLREEMTLLFYKFYLNMAPDELEDPNVVHAFVEEEHAESCFDARYHGIYDERDLELENLEHLIQDVMNTESPMPAQLASALRNLYSDDVRSWAAEHHHRQQEYAVLSDLCSRHDAPDDAEFDFRGRRYPMSEADDLLYRVRRELEDDRKFRTEFDGSVFTVHFTIARQMGKHGELCQRYRFHHQVQKLLAELSGQGSQMQSMCVLLSTRKELLSEELRQVLRSLRQLREGLAAVVSQTNQVHVPALKHVKDGGSLGELLPTESPVPELDLIGENLSLEWVERLHGQFVAVFDKLTRIHLKSLAAILAFQEQLASEWDNV